MIDKGYGIMPNVILYAKDLSDKQKLLYVMISSLCAEKGHCWASNKYFSEKLGFSEGWVSKNIADMGGKGYLKTTISKDKGNFRTIALGCHSIALECHTSGTVEPDPYSTGVPHNITTTNSKKKITKKDSDFFKCIWKDFPHQRSGSKEKTLNHYKNREAANKDIAEEISILNREIQLAVDDHSFLPAMQRRMRDFPPRSEIVINNRIKKIVFEIMQRSGDERKLLSEKFKKDFGEDIAKKYAKEYSEKKNKIKINLK